MLHERDEHAEHDREEDHRQHVALRGRGERVRGNHRGDLRPEHRAHASRARLHDLGELRARRARLEQAQIRADTGRQEVHEHDAGHDRERARRQVEQHRARAEAAELPQIAHARHARDQRRHDQRDHQHLQEAQEDPAELLAGERDVRDERPVHAPVLGSDVQRQPDGRAEEHGDQDPVVELQTFHERREYGGDPAPMSTVHMSMDACPR